MTINVFLLSAYFLLLTPLLKLSQSLLIKKQPLFIVFVIIKAAFYYLIPEHFLKILNSKMHVTQTAVSLMNPYDFWSMKLQVHEKIQHKDYLGLVFYDSSLGPPCSLCSSHSCPRSQMGKRSPAAPWGSFWTSCSENLCRPSPPLVHSSAPFLLSLGCIWPPCSVYPLGPAALLFFFPLSGEKKGYHWDRRAPDRVNRLGFSFKTAPFSRAESAI